MKWHTQIPVNLLARNPGRKGSAARIQLRHLRAQTKAALGCVEVSQVRWDLELGSQVRCRLSVNIQAGMSPICTAFFPIQMGRLLSAITYLHIITWTGKRDIVSARA